MTEQTDRGIKTIDRNTLPCKFYTSWWEDVAGDGGSRMEMSDCNYDGTLEMPDNCSCDKTCPCYQPVEVKVCQKHNREYYDVCLDCDNEMWGGK